MPETVKINFTCRIQQLSFSSPAASCHCQSFWRLVSRMSAKSLKRVTPCTLYFTSFFSHISQKMSVNITSSRSTVSRSMFPRCKDKYLCLYYPLRRALLRNCDHYYPTEIPSHLWKVVSQWSSAVGKVLTANREWSTGPLPATLTPYRVLSRWTVSTVPARNAN